MPLLQGFHEFPYTDVLRAMVFGAEYTLGYALPPKVRYAIVSLTHSLQGRSKRLAIILLEAGSLNLFKVGIGNIGKWSKNCMVPILVLD